MAVSAVVAVGAATAAYSGTQQKKAAKKQSEAAIQAATIEADSAKQIAAEQEAQAAALQKQKFEFEMQREAAVKQQNADLALSEQNQKTTDVTPTVQLNATAEDGVNSAANARKRRATFRPEYSSGVSI